jgi:hypothetical protein
MKKLCIRFLAFLGAALLALSQPLLIQAVGEGVGGVWEARRFQTPEYTLDAVQLFPQGCSIDFNEGGLCDIVMGDYSELAKWEMKDDTIVFAGSYVFHTATRKEEELIIPFGGVKVFFSRQSGVSTGLTMSDSTELPGSSTIRTGAEQKTQPPPNPQQEASIPLPPGWTMDMAVSVEDIEQTTGKSGYSLFPEASSDAKNGKPACGFVKDGEQKQKLTFSAFIEDGASKLSLFMEYASEEKQLPSPWWDSGYELTFTNNAKAVVILRGDTCFRIDWWPEGYPDDVTIGERLAVMLIQNIYQAK